MTFRFTAIAAVAIAASLAGCADNQSLLGNSSNLTTAAVATPAPKADPVCAGLATQIETLRKEGIADKVEKASQRKAKVSLTAAETAKADQLNKANFEFQAKCSTYKTTPVVAVTPVPAVTPAVAAKAAASTASQVKAATAVAKP